MGWLLLVVAIAFAAVNAGEGWVEVGNPGGVAVAGPASWGTNVWFALGIVVLPLLFPDGRLVSPRWRLVLWLAVLDVVLSVSSAMIKPGPLELQQSSGIENPLGVEGGLYKTLAAVEVPIGAVVLILAGASVVVRFRRSRGLERQQLKWFALVGVSTAACLAVAILFGTILADHRYNAIAVTGWLTGLALLGIGLPLATGFAIFRHRLYDVDVVIRRTLVYGALTATLGAALPRAGAADRARGREVEPRDRDLDARGRRARPPGPGAHPGGGRPALLPPPLRRRPHARGVRRAAA